MKKIIVLFFIIILIISSPTVLAENNQYEHYENEITELEDALPNDVKNTLKDQNINVMSIIRGESDFSQLWLIIKEYVLSGFFNITNLLSSLLILSVITMIVGVLTEDKTVDYILLLFSCILTLPPIIELLQNVARSLESACVFMFSLIPFSAALLMSSGLPTTGAGYSTAMFIFAEGIHILSETLLLPLSGGLLALSVSSSLFSNKLKNIVSFITKTVIISISTLLGAFIFLLGMQTSISKVSDSIGLKTAKYFSGSFIPIAGSFVSESLSVVLSSFSMLRSAIGIFSIISLIIIFLPVLLETVFIKLTFLVFGYFFESFGAEQVTALLKSIGGVLNIILSIMIACVVVFIISSALTVGGKV